MRSIAGLILLTLFLALSTQGQRARYTSIKGTVIDSTSRQPVEAATVSVFLRADSSLVNYGITSKKGEFSINQVPVGRPCWIMVSYTGYESRTDTFSILTESKEHPLPAIRLTKTFREMEEVVVSAQRPPVMIKKDTVEFNAGSFKTPVNGVVEDLLKQLPGVEVDAEGNITINGKKVSKITIDGKDFFGSDFKITTKNLPRDIIDKIQVVDYKTREAQFNKTTTGNEDKAINLTLKKGKDKGIFGRAGAGYGSEKRYESNASLNYFSRAIQLNFIGYANNTNRMNFGGGDFSMSKATSSFAGGGSGIATSKAAGLNFSAELSKKLKVNGSYFFNNSQNINSVTAQRQNILADTSFLYNSTSNSKNSTNGHRTYLNIDYKPDTTIDLYVNTSFNLSNGNNNTSNIASSSSMVHVPINASNNTFTSTPVDKSTGMEVFFGHRLHKQGRSFTLSMNYNYANRDADESNKAYNTFYTSGSVSATDTLDQRSEATSENDALNLSASWTEPISSKLNSVFRYNYSFTNSQSDKNTNRYDPVTQQWDIHDSLYSNSLRNSTVTHSPNMAFTYNDNKVNMSLGAGIQWLKQENIIQEQKNQLPQYYTNLFPSANIGYRYSKTGNINLNYNGRSQQPSIDQLQPVPDNTNTLYIRLGNPSLKPSFFHNINLGLQQYDSKVYWNAGIAFGTVRNQIMYETWFDSVQISKPINTNGNYSFSFNVNYSRGWKQPGWSLRVTTGTNGFFNRGVSFTSKTENITRSFNIAQRLALTYTFKELLTIMPSFIVRYNTSRYSINSEQNINYNSKSLTLNVFVNWPKRLILENNLQYNYNSRTAPGFPKGIPIWNMAANYQLFKNRQGTLRLAAFDMLKKNTSVFRSITPTYIEDTQVDVLKQYFLLSFIYNIKQFGR